MKGMSQLKISESFYCAITGFYSSSAVVNNEAELDMKNLISYLSSAAIQYIESIDKIKVSWGMESTKAPLAMVADLSKKYPNLRFYIHCISYDSNNCDYIFFYKAGIMTTYLKKSWTNLPVGIIDPTNGYKGVLEDE